MYSYSNEQWIQWLDRLAENHVVVIDSFLPPEVLHQVVPFLMEVEEQELLKPAKVGEATVEQRRSEIRSDFTYWLDESRDHRLGAFFSLIKELMDQLGKLLFLSVKGYEFHLAKYPKGGFYKPHLDQFDARSNRVISLVIYLNKDWQTHDGGELMLHEPQAEKIEPLLNRAVLFRSDTVLHEVLPANSARYSLTGWLLKQPSGVGVIGL